MSEHSMSDERFIVVGRKLDDDLTQLTTPITYSRALYLRNSFVNEPHLRENLVSITVMEVVEPWIPVETPA